VFGGVAGAGFIRSSKNHAERQGGQRMSQFKFGMDAIAESNSGGGDGGKTGEFAKLPSGTKLKVKLTGLQNIMMYYGYGVYKKVNTFIAKAPSSRNAKGFVDSGHTPWDLASKHYYDQAFKLTDGVDDKDALKEIKDSAEYKQLSGEGFKYSGKQRFAVGFIDIEIGKEIVLDFTRTQFNDVIKPALTKYDAKRDKIAFEIEKTGERQNTKITLMPVIDMDDDLTDKERANFDKFVGKDFDLKKFDGLLYEADEKEQIESLVVAGFDVSLIGLSTQGNTQQNTDPTEAF
jgi:hypothetical protein